jgi:hypothetical protein
LREKVERKETQIPKMLRFSLSLGLAAIVVVTVVSADQPNPRMLASVVASTSICDPASTTSWVSHGSRYEIPGSSSAAWEVAADGDVWDGEARNVGVQ